MSKSIIHRFFITAGIFLVVLLALPVLQFGFSTDGFQEKQGGILISGSYSGKSTGKTEIARLHIKSELFDLSFAQDSLKILDANGTTQSAKPLSWKGQENGIRVQFEKDITLDVYTSSDSGLMARLDVKAKSPVTLSLPIRFIGQIEREAQGPNVVTLKTKKGDVRFQLQAGLSLDKEGKTLSFKQSGGTYPSLVMAERRQNDASIVATLKNQTAMSESQFREGIAAWIGKAWKGWAVSRFNSERGTWTFAQEEERFSEKAMTAYWAEAYSRGVQKEIEARLVPAIEKHGDKLGWLSAPFVGKTALKARAMESETQEALREISKKLESKDASLFTRESLMHFLVDRGPFSLAKQVFQFAGDVDPSSVNLEIALGLIRCFVEYESFLGSEVANPFAKFEGLPERKILPSVRKTQNGFFVVNEKDECDVYLSFYAGTILIAYGKKTEKDAFIGVGQSLVNAVLGLSDDSGLVARTCQIQGGSIASAEGVLPPETLYPLIAENPYYPHYVSFAKDAYPGLWAWTSSRSLKASSLPEELTLVAEFPVGASHYLVVRGIKPFAKMQLYGIDYRTDPDFEMYNSSGWAYRSENQTLYLKLRHKAGVEKAKLSSGPAS